MPSPLDVFRQGVLDGVYPGGQLAASREGIRLASLAAGTRGPEHPKATPETLYDLASLTKPLATALLCARLLDEGRLRLEEPIIETFEKADPRITLEHLLAHAAGCVAHKRFDLALPPAIAPGTRAAHDDIVAQAAATPLVHAPGTSTIYSDLGFIMLGGILEARLGSSMSDALTQINSRLSSAADASSMPFFIDRRASSEGRRDDRTPRGPIAPTEDGVPLGMVHDENARAMGGVAGHAGLFGTAEGVLAIVEAWLRAYHGQDNSLLTRATARRFWSPTVVPGSERTPGWDRPSLNGSSTGGRWPRHAVGHLGFTGTSVWVEPERALAVVLVTNRVCPTRANEQIRALRPRLYDAAWAAWS
ncbi:MAG: beta-lactamase family protein [Deltaproteobacteria bacterium]|nr:beta-lactamase family protein [Deltaproteobacteria bacterium]